MPSTASLPAPGTLGVGRAPSTEHEQADAAED
jgi:hypothetical protein